MQGINQTRIKGASVLLTLIVSGLFTNCNWCEGPNAVETTSEEHPDGDEELVTVPGCGGDVKYVHYAHLYPESCGLTAQDRDASCNFRISEGAMQRCPEEGSPTPLSPSTPFTLFWTICNYADHAALATEVKTYNLLVYQVDSDGREGTVPFATIPFTQPMLDRCMCGDVFTNFNNAGDPSSHALPAGTYFFRLDGNYEMRNGLGYTRGCDPASFSKISIQ